MRLTALIALMAATLLSSSFAEAQRYSVSVSRTDSNLYRAQGGVLIVTRYCYVYAYAEDAILTPAELIFLDSRDRCDIKYVLSSTTVKPGRYSVHVSQEADNLYEVMAAGVYLQTSLCLALALADDAILDVRGGTFGELIFINNRERCTVEGIYSRAKL
jgi:hypothetical protein